MSRGIAVHAVAPGAHGRRNGGALALRRCTVRCMGWSSGGALQGAVRVCHQAMSGGRWCVII
jgi:hypothetical protein